MDSLTRKQVRQVDRLAIEQLGMPGILLMENAGINATVAILSLIDNTCRLPHNQAQATVLCGGGNNGGDGYVIARHLHNWGVPVNIFTACDPDTLTGDAQTNYLICRNMGLPITPITGADELASCAPGWQEADVLIDALLGTGFTGQVRPHLAAVIETVNSLDGPRIVAVDIPSGLDCDSGQLTNATIRADLTISFVAAKIGFAQEQAAAYLGQVKIADIGVPHRLIEQVLEI
jgi:hydroxyethylthiazole kinase-like uncharacterized protein yjeF